MEIVIQILQVILSLSLLVFIHELGHFFFARMFGVRVEKFYIFFGAAIFKFRIGDTEFGMGWIPFGGYCKISGMIDESLDTEQLKGEPKPWEFRSKPAWQRLLIMTGGVVMNVVLAMIIFVGVSHRWGDSYVANADVRYGYAFNDVGRSAGFEDGDKIVTVGGRTYDNWAEIYPALILDNLPPVEVERAGERITVQIPKEMMDGVLDEWILHPRVPFVVAEVGEGTDAAKAGFMAGDSLVAVDGVEMLFFDQYKRALRERRGHTVALAVARGGAVDTLSVAIPEDGGLEIMHYDYPYFLTISTRDYTFAEAVPVGFKRAGDKIGEVWKNLKLIASPETGAYKSVGGFVAIGNLFGREWNWQAFWNITGLLSVMLAVMNILPIPALDGGHVLFLLWEVVTRRKPSDKFLERAQVVGLLILLALIVLVNANDIYRFFIK